MADDLGMDAVDVHAEARAVLGFWFALSQEEQFAKSAARDAEIRTRFGALRDRVLQDGAEGWRETRDTLLAAIILLDQFSRNLYRGEAGAFAGDARTQQLVIDAIAQGWHRQLPVAGRVFLFMPLMHAEDLALQQECVIRFAELHDEAPEAVKKNILGSLEFAEKHRDIVAMFGRFPHRNAALGRTDTVEEREFLVTGPRFGQ